MTQLTVEQFFHQYENGKHPLPPEYIAALEKAKPKLFAEIRQILDATQTPSEQEKSLDNETPPASEVVNQETGTALQRYLFDHRWLWSSNFPGDNDSNRHLHFIDCVIDAVRAQLLEIPQGNYSGFNRYDTDDQLVLHVWDKGESFDIRVPKTLETYYETPWNRRAPLTAAPSQSATNTKENENTAGINEPIWDSRNSDEPRGAPQTKTDEEIARKHANESAASITRLPFRTMNHNEFWLEVQNVVETTILSAIREARQQTKDLG